MSMTRIDKKLSKLAEKMAQMQQEMVELEAQKAAKLDINSDEIRQLADRIRTLNKESGQSISDILSLVTKACGGRSPRKTGGTIAIKYRDPANYENTWTGRGIAPLWLQRYEAIGRKRDEFLAK